jgi:hypothetical protein
MSKPAMAQAPSARPPLDPSSIAQAVEVLLGRPATPAEITALAGHRSLATLRLAVMRGAAFRGALPRDAAPRPGAPFALPVALLRPPEDPALPWRFAEPDLRDPVCQLATAGQMESPDYLRWCGVLRDPPGWHVAQWTRIWLLAAIEKAGLYKPGLRALGLDLAEGHLACVLASQGQQVVVTPRAGQTLEALLQPDLIAADAFDARVIPFSPLTHPGFDLVWSQGSVERCGSRAAALELIRASLDWLRPGGVALHVVRLDLSSDEAAPEGESLVALRRQDLLALTTRLIAEGHEVWPLNLHPGTHPLDEEVDPPLAGPTHLKAEVEGHVLGSFGLVLRRAGSPDREAGLP